MKMSGKFYTPSGLPLGKSPWYPLNRRLGGSPGYGKKILLFSGIEP